MRKQNITEAWKQMKKNLFFLFSALAFLCLFVRVSRIFVLLATVYLVGTAFIATKDLSSLRKAASPFLLFSTLLLAVLLLLFGYRYLGSGWANSGYVRAAAARLHLAPRTLLALLGILGVTVGGYAACVFSFFGLSLGADLLSENMLVREPKKILANLGKNCFFCLSAVALLLLEAQASKVYFWGLGISLLLLLLVSTQINDIFYPIKKNPIPVTAFAALSALGVCLRYGTYGQAYLASLPGLQGMLPHLPLVSIVLSVLAFAFPFITISYLFLRLGTFLKETEFFSSSTKAEWMIYGGIAVGLVVLSTGVFLSSQAFYGTLIPYDVIYTGDSPMLVQNDVYLSLTYAENDLRQPLFALFAAPFMGAPYAIGRLLSLPLTGMAIWQNAMQVLMLVFANCLLVKAMGLTRTSRVAFMLLLSATYAQLLSVLMMEQYIVAYFWLAFYLYSVCVGKKGKGLFLWGAGGSLLTSLALLPTVSSHHSLQKCKTWLGDVIKCGVGFLLLLLAFGRFDVLYSLSDKITSLDRFTGKTVSFGDKVYQYFSFVGDCFRAPDAGVDTTTFSHTSWQLRPVTTVAWLGVVILLLSAISVAWNRKRKVCRLAALWIVLSLAMLLFLGWGTKENGLILYALYFGWSFFVLLFALVEKIGEKLKMPLFVPIVTGACLLLLAFLNVPAIAELVRFAAVYYPT